MTREFFNKQFMALLSVYVYAQKIPDEGQDVYWEMLKGIPEEKFTSGVRKCLATCRFFPTIAELGEASLPTKLRSNYNPHVYIEPTRVGWQEQVAQIEERRRVIAESNQERRQIDKASREE